MLIIGKKLEFFLATYHLRSTRKMFATHTIYIVKLFCGTFWIDLPFFLNSHIFYFESNKKLFFENHKQFHLYRELKKIHYQYFMLRTFLRILYFVTPMLWLYGYLNIYCHALITWHFFYTVQGVKDERNVRMANEKRTRSSACCIFLIKNHFKSFKYTRYDYTSIVFSSGITLK